MKWIKFKTPYRAELIKEITLESDGKRVVSAGKNDPVAGKITHYRDKKVGRNNVRMYLFYPDVAADKGWELSSNWFKKLRKEENA